MSFDLVQTLFYFISGGFIIFLAVTVLRDSFASRLNRVTGSMLLFAGLGPVLLSLGSIIDPSLSQEEFQRSLWYNLIYFWEFFFPLLLLFSWIFPEDRLSELKYPKLRYLIFAPQVIHLIVVLFFTDIINFVDSLRVDTVQEGFSAIILKPFSVVVSWITYLFSFIKSYHLRIFGFFNIIYIALAIYYLESGRSIVKSPRLQTQTRIVLRAIWISMSIYVLAQVGPLLSLDYFNETVQSILYLVALLSGAGLLIYATIRYQFLDVRLAFRQSFVYSITSAILVGIYILLVVETKRLLVPLFGEQAEVVSYAFIILILLLFQPINHWIDEFTRSLFIRTRTDHRNILERFSKQVISLFDPKKLRNIIDETLKTSLLVERVYFILYEDSLSEYVLLESDDNQKRVVIKREDILLRGINQLDKPTFWHTMGQYLRNSELAEELDQRDVKIVLPLKDSEHLLGFLALSNKAAGYNFSSEDMNLMGVLSNQMVTALTNARLYVDSLERIRLEEEVTMARQIQLDLLPANPPKLEMLEISSHSTPSRTVGGDFFDFLENDNGKLGICIADASGKGMPAALMIAQTQAILKSEVSNGNPIDKVMKNINKQLVCSSSSEKYVTMFYGELNIETGMFQYTNAGHNYPVLVKKDGKINLLERGGPIVGALPDMPYEAAEVQLEKDDILFFFTDGLSEAMNNDEVEYSEERIRTFICDHREIAPDMLVDSILKDVRSHDATFPPRDDTTIIALKVKEDFNTNGKRLL